MKLIANECVQCKRVIGYLTSEALQIPTMCILCAFDKDTMQEWGHTISKSEKPIAEVLRDYRFSLNHLKL